MKGLTGAVYDPPKAGLPFIAVVLGTDGEVVTARSVPSAAAGEQLIKKVFEDFAKASGGTVLRG